MKKPPLRRKPNLIAILGIVLAATIAGCISPGSNSESIASSPSPNVFPTVEGINLLGQELDLPQDLRGSPVVVIVAFEREQQAIVDPWLGPMEELERSVPRFRFYELPVIYEVSMMERFWINNGMRSGIEDELARSRTITIYTDRDKFMQLVGIPSKDSIYVLLLNSNKEIVYRERGTFTPEKFTALQGVIQGMTGR